jgi:hypothetical protein
MSTVSKEIRKAIAVTCMKHGIEDVFTILAETGEAIRGFGNMTVAGYKAHETRKRMISRKLRRR